MKKKVISFKYVNVDSDGWVCSDEDCKMPVPNKRTGHAAIGLYHDGKLIHYKCAHCRGTLKRDEMATDSKD